MLCDCLFARLSLSDVYSVAKFYNVHLLKKSVLRGIANVVCTGQNAYPPVTLRNYISMLFCKNIYIILGVQLKMTYRGTKYQFFGFCRYIMKGVNWCGAKCRPRGDVVIQIK